MLNCKTLIKKLPVESELKKTTKIDSSYFRGKNYFGDAGTQNYLVFQPMYRYFKIAGNDNEETSS